MRVIAGSARHLLLKTLPGNDTRPTTDMIKETLFNMINFDLPGTLFMDLFAGSGAIGIEALSRGAKECVFVDNNSKVTSVIKENLMHTGFDQVSNVITSDSVSALRRLERTHAPFDIIFMDPPYGYKMEDSVLSYLSKSDLCSQDTLLIIEMDIKSDTDHFEQLGFYIDKVKSYKTNKHVFVRRNHT